MALADLKHVRKFYLLRVASKSWINTFNSLKQTSWNNRTWPKKKKKLKKTVCI